MINDRGTKKWTSIMIPEHVEKIKEMYAEFDYKEKPELDEQQIAQNEFRLCTAMRGKVEVRITYFANHDYNEIEGLIKGIRNGHIYIKDMELPFEDLVDVDVVHSIFDDF